LGDDKKKKNCFLSYLYRFIAPPLIPMVIYWACIKMYGIKVPNLPLIVAVYLIFGYLTMLIMVLPWYLGSSEIKLSPGLASSMGIKLGVLISLCLLLPFYYVFHMDDSWKEGLYFLGGNVLAGGLFGSLTGTFFCLLAFNKKGEKRP